MTAAETELEMVRRHVREGAKHIFNQRALIDRMTINGLQTVDAEALLANFQWLQDQHKLHLARIEDG